jgi:hypothetical protein
MPRPREVTEQVADTEFTPPGQAKRRKPQGPRKEKPIYLLFQVQDADGNLVSNAKLKVILATKDTEAVLNQKSDDNSLVKIEVAKSNNGDGPVEAVQEE